MFFSAKFLWNATKEQMGDSLHPLFQYFKLEGAIRVMQGCRQKCFWEVRNYELYGLRGLPSPKLISFDIICKLHNDNFGEFYAFIFFFFTLMFFSD